MDFTCTHFWFYISYSVNLLVSIKPTCALVCELSHNLSIAHCTCLLPFGANGALDQEINLQFGIDSLQHCLKASFI